MLSLVRGGVLGMLSLVGRCARHAVVSGGGVLGML